VLPLLHLDDSCVVCAKPSGLLVHNILFMTSRTPHGMRCGVTFPGIGNSTSRFFSSRTSNVE
jgi:hypothetical protein